MNKIFKQEKGYEQMQTSSGLMIIASLTLFLFIGDKNNFVNNETHITILNIAVIFGFICIFINLILVSILTKHIKIMYSISGSDIDESNNILKKYYNKFSSKINFTVTLFWISIFSFFISFYCFTLFKLDLVTKEKKFLCSIISCIFILSFLLLIIFDYDDTKFLNKYGINYKNLHKI